MNKKTVFAIVKNLYEEVEDQQSRAKIREMLKGDKDISNKDLMMLQMRVHLIKMKQDNDAWQESIDI